MCNQPRGVQPYQDIKLKEILKILKGYTETDYDDDEIFEEDIEKPLGQTSKRLSGAKPSPFPMSSRIKEERGYGINLKSFME